jgi:glycosyltransferase involved in cell wall biosynthesis
MTTFSAAKLLRGGRAPANDPGLSAERASGQLFDRLPLMARIAFLLPNLKGGGAERVALTLMDDLIGAGHEVDLVLARADGELLSLLPAQVQIFDLKARRMRAVLGPLIRYLRVRRPDAAQAFMWPLTAIAILARRMSRTRCRMVVSDHSMLSIHYAHLGPARRALLRGSIRLLYPSADARIAVSRPSADDLAKLGGIARDSITIINNPVGRPPAGPSVPGDIDHLWAGEGPRVLTVGSLKAEKNQMLLLDAFAQVGGSPPPRLMIIGEGELRPALARRAKELGISDRVVMPGFKLDPWPYYASADLFVLSSDYEGYPLVLVEALRCGLRVVSTDCVSGPREILGSGHGRLVPVGDAAALAEAMAKSLSEPHDPDRQKARAELLSSDSLRLYEEIMLPRA